MSWPRVLCRWMPDRTPLAPPARDRDAGAGRARRALARHSQQAACQSAGGLPAPGASPFIAPSPSTGPSPPAAGARAAARGLAALLALAGALAPVPAASRGDGVGWIEARQLVELFGESCLRFATPDGLRGWLQGQGYRRMPEAQEQSLLRGPGRAYDASTRTGHLALLSRDDGWCIAVADTVDPARLSSLLEQRLRMAGLSFQTVGDDAPPDRSYSVQHGSHQSLLVVEVARVDDRLQASLLLAPME